MVDNKPIRINLRYPSYLAFSSFLFHQTPFYLFLPAFGVIFPPPILNSFPNLLPSFYYYK